MIKKKSSKWMKKHGNSSMPSNSKLQAFAFLLGSCFISLNTFAEGSRTLYPSNDDTTLGYRTYLNARAVTFSNGAAFDPYPNLGIHKVYLKAGEKIHLGSSTAGLFGTQLGYIRLSKPDGTLATQINSNGSTLGRIANRNQELAGPNIDGTNPSGFTPLSYTVLPEEEGIYEVEFGALGTGTNLNVGDNYIARASSWTQPTYAGGNGLIIAWDITVTTGENVAIPGRVFMNVFNGTGPNNLFRSESFYGKFFVLTPQSYIYLVDNNGQNGASFNFFSNNKGIIETAGAFSSPPSYSSFNSTNITELNSRIWDPRQAEGQGNFTNKIFYTTPDLDNFPATAPTYFSRVATPHTGTTWLKGEPITPEISGLVATCGGTIRFISNVEGHFQILIDGDGDNKYESTADRTIIGNTVMGENEVIWDGRDGNGVNMSSGTVVIKARITTAEVHFPFLDMEANEHGILINRIGGSDADTVFWNDKSITSASPDHDPVHVQSSSPLINFGGIKSSSNGHKWGTKPTGVTGQQPHFYGNNKTLDTWTFVFGEAEASIQFNACLTISGSVWNDVNNDGNNTGEHNVSGNNASEEGSIPMGAGYTLYAYLLDENDRVIDRVEVAANGTYTLNTVPPNMSGMKLTVSTDLIRFGTIFSESTLPNGWKNTKENVGMENITTQSADNDFIIELNTITSNITNQNFGIQQIPVVSDNTLPEQTNPGGTNTYAIPTESFTANDFNGGRVDSIKILEFPTAITSIKIGTITYYLDAGSVPADCTECMTFPSEGIIVEVNIDAHPTLPILIDPIDGAVEVSIPFAAIDNGNAISADDNIGHVIIPFVPGHIISGNIMDDRNGLSDNTVNGDNISTNLGLSAILVDENSLIVAITSVDPATGTYTFNNIPNGTYEIVLTSAIPAESNIGEDISAIPVMLPEGWAHTGENIGLGEGYDAQIDGKNTNIIVTNADVYNVNFGINEIPETTPTDLAATPNPSGTDSVNVSAGFGGTDPLTDAIIEALTITGFPTNTTSITIGTQQYFDPSNPPSNTTGMLPFPTDGITIPTNADGTPNEANQFFVDPIDGDITVNIPFTVTDEAGLKSPVGSFNAPFTPTYTLAGNILNDANGLNNNIVDGNPITEDLGLHVILVDENNIVTATGKVDPVTGSYLFTGIENGTYNIILTNTAIDAITKGDEASSITVSLPNNWVNTGENVGILEGSDDAVNGILTSITVSNSNITEANFGIQVLPFSNDQSLNLEKVPTVGTSFILVNTITGNDREDTDGENAIWSNTPITITATPSNGFKIFYDGNELSVGDKINNYDPSLLTMEATASTPDTAKVTYFGYKVVDAAGFESAEPATYVVTFDNALSVSLTSFDATLQNQYVQLNWVTATEAHNKGFSVERSTQGNNQWEAIGFVNSQTNNGNSNSVLKYQFVDKGFLKGDNFYRLKIVDINNAVSYSEVRKINISLLKNNISIYPNPTTQKVAIDGLQGNEKITIFNALGMNVFETNATENLIQIDMEKYATGMYLIKISSSLMTTTETIIKQ